jgi:hypothetical protein
MFSSHFMENLFLFSLSVSLDMFFDSYEQAFFECVRTALYIFIGLFDGHGHHTKTAS